MAQKFSLLHCLFPSGFACLPPPLRQQPPLYTTAATAGPDAEPLVS